ncbi:B12-binding domain-containing radical SAM protein [Streptacidiphilus monticola]
MTRAVAVLRDPQDFHHYPTYRQATLAIHRWFQLLSLRSLPGVFSGLTLRTAGAVNYQSHGDLADPEVLDAVNGAFLDYIRGPFRDVLRSRPWRLVGLSVNYAAQLPFALRMAREIREQVPDAVVVFGGTEVCDDVKYARDDADVWRMFPHADLIVPGEGETPLVDILCAVRDGGGFAGLPGVLHRGADRRAMRINYEHVGALPAPKYDVWDWEAYWSPEPVVLYSPTRGCYWNKCTFCDYGLNTDRPTSPSRERPVARVLEDLAGIASFARTLYFSVDAMSPRFLRELCDGLTGAGLGLRWSAELRLERTFPARGTAARLRDAGCVAIAFGYESASQRILDLIDKGVRIEQVPEILRELAAAGIGAQMMGFTGFPGETAEEAEETYAFLARHRELWSLAGVGGFSLTPGSIVARRPERFGIEVLPLPREHDIARQLSWRDLDSGVTTHGEARRPVPQALKAQIRRGLGEGRSWEASTAATPCSTSPPTGGGCCRTGRRSRPATGSRSNGWCRWASRASTPSRPCPNWRPSTPGWRPPTPVCGTGRYGRGWTRRGVRFRGAARRSSWRAAGSPRCRRSRGSTWRRRCAAWTWC